MRKNRIQYVKLSIKSDSWLILYSNWLLCSIHSLYSHSHLHCLNCCCSADMNLSHQYCCLSWLSSELWMNWLSVWAAQSDKTNAQLHHSRLLINIQFLHLSCSVKSLTALSSITSVICRINSDSNVFKRKLWAVDQTSHQSKNFKKKQFSFQHHKILRSDIFYSQLCFTVWKSSYAYSIRCHAVSSA